MNYSIVNISQLLDARARAAPHAWSRFPSGSTCKSGAFALRESWADEDHAPSLTCWSKVVCKSLHVGKPLCRVKTGEMERPVETSNHELVPRSCDAQRQFERAVLTGRESKSMRLLFGNGETIHHQRLGFLRVSASKARVTGLSSERVQ